MTLSLVVVVLLTWAVGLLRYGPFSFVAAGIFCFTVYSLPALSGLVYPFTGMYLVAASPTAVNATALAWAVFCIVIATPTVGYRVVVSDTVSPSQGHADLTPLIAAALCVSLIGFVVIAATEGPFFFLQMRDEQTEGFARMLWRWVNVVGLVASMLTRSWRAAAVFAAGIALYFLSGDRTVVVITAFCLLVALGRGRSWREVFRPRVILGGALLGVLGIAGKPIYMAVKLGAVDFLGIIATSDWLGRAVVSFEPFTTFNILNLVVVNDFRVSIESVLEGVLGQFLLLPSAFGIDPNSFSVGVQQEFAPRLSWGIAGNYWAQGWALGGPVGVSLYAVIYAAALRLCERASQRGVGAASVFFSLLGALFAVYVHRNALDNLLSFVRQIVFVWIILAISARVIAPFFVSRNAGPSRAGIQTSRTA